MAWAAVIAGGAALVGGYLSSNAAGNAADQQNQQAQNSLQLQQQMHNQTVAGLQPYNDAGRTALSTMQQLNGGNYSSFTQSPDYQFALDQGTKALDASAAAKGTLFSGGYGRQMQQFGQGLASQNYNQYYNHLQGIASQGESAAANVGYNNMGYANAATGINTNNGQAQAMGTLGQAGAWNNALNQMSAAYGQYGSSYGGGSGGGNNGASQPGGWNGNQGWYPGVPATGVNYTAPVGG